MCNTQETNDYSAYCRGDAKEMCDCRGIEKFVLQAGGQRTNCISSKRDRQELCAG